MRLSELLCRCLGSQTIFSLLTAQNLQHMVTICLFNLSNSESKLITEQERHFRDISIAFLGTLITIAEAFQGNLLVSESISGISN